MTKLQFEDICSFFFLKITSLREIINIWLKIKPLINKQVNITKEKTMKLKRSYLRLSNQQPYLWGNLFVPVYWSYWRKGLVYRQSSNSYSFKLLGSCGFLFQNFLLTFSKHCKKRKESSMQCFWISVQECVRQNQKKI